MIDADKKSTALGVLALSAMPKLAAARPRPCISLRRITRAPKQFLYFVWHTVVPYGEVEPPAIRMEHFASDEFPSDETVRVFEALNTHSEGRGSRLEAKSAALLSTAGIVASVEIGVMTVAGASTQATSLLLASIVLLVLSMLAGYRALHVGRSSAMWIGAALDEKNREHADTKRRYALNLLNSALVSEARNDHIADFVRAAALFLVLSTVPLLAAALGVAVLWPVTLIGA